MGNFLYNCDIHPIQIQAQQLCTPTSSATPQLSLHAASKAIAYSLDSKTWPIVSGLTNKTQVCFLKWRVNRIRGDKGETDLGF